MVVLLASLAGGMIACGSNGTIGNTGTTPGTYVVTVTGTAGATTASGTVTIVVD